MTEIHRRKRAGFSAIELTASISALVVVAGFAVVSIQGARLGIQANGALDQVVAQLHTARELAMAERRSYQILFQPPNQIQLRQLELPSIFTDFRPVSLGAAAQFTLLAGLPDTPQGFGNVRAIDFGKTPTVAFASDGRLVDSAGEPVNGTVFLGIPERPETARAVTVEGATGRITAYHWTGSAWEE
jgi:Tfp pilus assembly protein FimT